MKPSTYVKIGIVIVVTLATTFWGINFLKGKDIFKKENIYTIIYDKVDGLTNSSAVLLRGYKVGQVRDIRFTSNKHESLTVEIALGPDIHLTKGTIAHIFSSDLMGTKSIDLMLASTDTLLKSGDTLLPKIEESLSDQVKLQMLPLKKKTENLIASVETAIEAMKSVFNQNTGQELRKSLEKVQLAIVAIERSSSNLDTILTNGQGKIRNILVNVESITENLSKNNGQVTHILHNLSAITDSLSRSNLPQTILNAEKSLAELNIMLEKINSGTGTAGKFVNDSTFYVSLNQATQNLNTLLVDINKNPARYVHLSLIDFSRAKKKAEE